MNAIKDSTEKCFKHLMRTVNGTQRDEVFKSLTDFVGVVDKTVKQWTVKFTPIGEQLIRLRFYLDALGYQVVELGRLKAAIRKSGEIFSFGILSIKDISELVGYTSGRGGDDQVIRVFRGVQGVLPKTFEGFEEIARTYTDELEKKKAEKSFPKLDRLAVANGRDMPTVAPIESSATDEQPSTDHDAIIKAIAHLVNAATPLVELASSNSFSKEERDLIRKLAGHNQVFRLANRLYRLCGEKTRTIHEQSSTKTATATAGDTQ